MNSVIYMTINNEILRRAVKKWGIPSQVKVCIEELTELVQVLCKLDRKINGANITNLIDEIADVEIMLQQIKLIYKDGDCPQLDLLIEKKKEEKIDRLEKMLNNNRRW